MIVDSGALTKKGPFEWPYEESVRALDECNHKHRKNLPGSWSPGSHLFIQRVQEHSCLHSLSQTHFISQDRICALGPREAQPVQSFQLVGMQGAPCYIEVLWLPVIFHCWLQWKEELGFFMLAKQLPRCPSSQPWCSGWDFTLPPQNKQF